jgi:hypothetical protein
MKKLILLSFFVLLPQSLFPTKKTRTRRYASSKKAILRTTEQQWANLRFNVNKEITDLNVLAYVAAHNDPDFMRELLHFYYPSLKSLINTPTGSYGVTPLSYAVGFGQLDQAKILLEHDADVNCRFGFDNLTPVEHAILAKNIPMIRLLKPHATQQTIYMARLYITGLEEEKLDGNTVKEQQRFDAMRPPERSLKSYCPQRSSCCKKILKRLGI